MSVITASPRVRARNSALWQLFLTELRLSLRDKVGPIWGLAFPSALLIVFGSIPSFSKPMASLGGYPTLDVYVPIVILFSIALISLIPMPMVLTLFYPMLFFSGLWYSIPLMASALQHVAHATPLGAAWEAVATAAVGHWPPALPLVTLAIYAIGFGLAAARFFRW